MVDIQTIGVLVTAASVSVAAIYYAFTLRITQKNQELSLKAQEHALESRQTQLTMQLYEKMSSTEYLTDFMEILEKWSWTDYDDFKVKYGKEGDPKNWRKVWNVCMEWEQIGILMKYGAFDPNMLYDQWAGIYIRFWEKMESAVIGMNLEDEPRGGTLEYAEDMYYFFKERAALDRVDFRLWEQARLEKRASLGLRPRPAYK